MTRIGLVSTVLIVLAVASRPSASLVQITRATPTGMASPRVTNVAIGSSVLRRGVERFGINLSGQTFYDSGQMLKNLVTRNPGFEGETWQAIFHCTSATNTSCTDNDPHLSWPDHFLDHATFLVISGPAKGVTGIVGSSLRRAGPSFTLDLGPPIPGLTKGDFLQVKLEKSGNAAAGWWVSQSGGARITTELHDVAPDSPGKQALRVDASSEGGSASVSSFFDSLEAHSFVQLRGSYSLRFRAKWLSGDRSISTRLVRGRQIIFTRNMLLAPTWQDYSFDFKANEDGLALGTVGLTFQITHSSILLDDVELMQAAGSPANPTIFRDEVVETVRSLRPGILRFMDNGTSFGSTLDDLLAPPFARRRGGILFGQSNAEDIPIGLQEELQLAQAVGADPWYTLPATTSPAEAAELIEFLAGPSSTAYGSKRAALGRSLSWTAAFHKIHLEFGNEMWGTYPGASIANPHVYQERSYEIFSSIEGSPYFQKTSFDLVGNAQSENLWWTREAVRIPSRQTSIGFAPYLFSQLNDSSSSEKLFGAMFAEPELMDTTGIMAQQAHLVQSAAYPLNPVVYEVNLGTVSGTNPAIKQTDIDSTVASLGAGLAVVDHMLLMLRELGITTQCFFALPEYRNVFSAPGSSTLTTPLFGAVVDMGGSTNRRRPIYYALQLANRALLNVELTTSISGENPTWDQPPLAGASGEASHPHLLQTFAFADGLRRSLILLNLSRSAALPVTFSGPGCVQGKVSELRLTAQHITDTNEQQQNVSPASRLLSRFDPSVAYSLPAYSMTVLEWKVAR